jgi:hypothetical protein
MASVDQEIAKRRKEWEKEEERIQRDEISRRELIKDKSKRDAQAAKDKAAREKRLADREKAEKQYVKERKTQGVASPSETTSTAEGATPGGVDMGSPSPDNIGETGGGLKVPGKVQTDIAGKIKEREAEASTEPTYTGPTGSTGTKVDDQGNITVETKLTPEQEAILKKGQELTSIGQDLAKQELGGFTPFKSTAVMPKGFEYTDAMKPLMYRDNLDKFYTGAPSSVYDVGGASDVAANLVKGYKGFEWGTPEAERSRIEEEVFQRLTRNVDKDYQLEKDQMEQTLHNRGIPLDPSNPAYKTQLDALNEKYLTIKADARGQAVQLGGGELDRSYNQARGTHQQRISDVGSMQGFGLSGYQQRQSDLGQQVGRELAGHQQKQADIGQGFSQGLTATQQGYAEQAQGFGQDLTTQQQRFNEITGLQNLGTGYMPPNFPQYQPPSFNTPNASEIDIAINKLKNDYNISNRQLDEIRRRSGGGGGGNSGPQQPQQTDMYGNKV